MKAANGISPASATGSARTAKSVMPIGRFRAEKAFTIACTAVHAIAVAVAAVLPRHSGRDAIAVAAAHVGVRRAHEGLVRAAAVLMDGDCRGAWEAMVSTMFMVEVSTMPFVDTEGEYNGLDEESYAAVVEAWRRLDEWYRYERSRNPGLVGP